MSLGTVLDSAKFVVDKAQDVSIPADGVDALAHILLSAHTKGAFSLKGWSQQPLNPKPHECGDDSALAWILVVDTLNFCFWHPTPSAYFVVEFAGATYRGYMSLCALINRALQENVPILDPNYLKNLTEQQAKHIFRSSTETEIPQFSKRIEVLRELGAVIVESFGGSWREIVLRAAHNAQKLVELIVTHISSYDDKCLFDGRQVYFRKRAQILVADIWACFENEGIGHFDDIDSITMFADYRVPQSLAFFGAIKYSDRLLDLLKTNPFLAPGSREECEIRAASIWSVELVRRRLIELHNDQALQVGEDEATKPAPINAIVIDFYLWDYAKAFSAKMDHIPIHKTMTHFY